MAHSEIVRHKSSNHHELTKLDKKIVQLLGDGYSSMQIANALAKGDLKAAKRWRQKIRRLALRDDVAQMLAGQAKGEMVLGLPSIASAVVKRAERGRTDAAKLVFEATGFHNSKIQHEHSGEIEVKLTGVPRPIPVETTDDVVDAEVVE